MNYGKEHVQDIIMKLELSKRIKDLLIEELENSPTPDDFNYIIFYVSEVLDSLSRWIDENLRKNWHSIFCECDECIKLDQEEIEE